MSVMDELTPMSHAEKMPGAAARGAAWWWLAVIVGILVSLPAAWLLSHLALLPFFLGLFFFALLGLVIGAIMHRLAAAGRPYSRHALYSGTTVVVLAGWGASLAQEAQDVPRKLAQQVMETVRTIGERTPEQYRREIADQIRERLRERYPPGGRVGYLRWVLASGELNKGEIESVDVPLLAAQRRWGWAARAVLSLALFAFGIGSQTSLLRLDVDPTVRAIDRKARAPGNP